jgi:hypothetical protein
MAGVMSTSGTKPNEAGQVAGPVAIRGHFGFVRCPQICRPTKENGMIRIEKVKNGYIVSTWRTKEVLATLDEVLGRLLLHFEGRCESFGGDSYGKVIVERTK